MYVKYFGGLDMKYIIKNIGKISIAGAGLGIFANFFYKIRPGNLWLLVTIALAGAIYLALILALKIDGVDEIKEKFLKKVKKNK